MRYALSMLAVPWVAALSPAPAHGQCRPLDRDGKQFQYHIGLYASATGSDPKAAIRDSVKLGSVPASQVVLITQATVCRKANGAYRRFLAGTGGPPFSGQVYVLRAGSTYAVMDPAFYYDPQLPHEWVIVILDSSFKVLSKF